MKLNSIFLAGFLSLTSLASCVSEMPFEGGVEKENQGQMELNVSLLTPETRAVTTVNNFPVIIYGPDGNLVQSYSKVSDVPSKMTLNVGNYKVESHTPGDIEKKMTSPYYKGVKDVEIVKGITTQVDVLCKMLNSIISLEFDPEFLETFSSWSVSIDDGSTTALTFLSTDNDANPTVYWYFGEDGVRKLTVNFRGVTKDGSSVAANNELTKEQADQSYNDDRDNFCGGDALTLKFSTTEATDGKLVGIALNADVTFTETNKDITVNVVDVPGNFEPEDPDSGSQGGGNTPGAGGGEDDNSIVLTLPAPVSFDMLGAMAADPTTGDVKMEATNGLKSVLVKVESDSDDLMEQLAEFPDIYPGVDLVNGCEVVGNQNLVEFLGSLNKIITVPSEGDKEYVFPVGQFYSFLGILPGHHNFIMTVTDMNGNTKSGTIKITILE